MNFIIVIIRLFIYLNLINLNILYGLVFSSSTYANITLLFLDSGIMLLFNIIYCYLVCKIWNLKIKKEIIFYLLNFGSLFFAYIDYMMVGLLDLIFFIYLIFINIIYSVYLTRHYHIKHIKYMAFLYTLLSLISLLLYFLLMYK